MSESDFKIISCIFLGIIIFLLVYEYYFCVSLEKSYNKKIQDIVNSTEKTSKIIQRMAEENWNIFKLKEDYHYTTDDFHHPSLFEDEFRYLIDKIMDT